MSVPRLHVVTDDEVLVDPRFHERAIRLLSAHGRAVALHLRGPGTSASRLFDLAHVLAPVARASGALLLLNDRVDVALAVDADGVQLGARSLPVTAARALREDWMIGASIHSLEEVADAEGPFVGDADFLVLGTIWETASHPGRPGAGTVLIRDVCERAGRPVIAIGGVTPERAALAREAGASGVAALRGIWQHDDAAGAAAGYLASMDERVGGSA